MVDAEVIAPLVGPAMPAFVSVVVVVPPPLPAPGLVGGLLLDVPPPP